MWRRGRDHNREGEKEKEKKKKNKGKGRKGSNILKYNPHQNIPPLHPLLPHLTIPPRPRSALASHPFQGHGPLCPSCPRESLCPACTARTAEPVRRGVQARVPVSRCTTSGEENPFAPQTSLLATRNASFSGCCCCYSRRRSTRHPHTIQGRPKTRQYSPAVQYNNLRSFLCLTLSLVYTLSKLFLGADDIHALTDDRARRRLLAVLLWSTS